jgi:thymidylate synthase
MQQYLDLVRRVLENGQVKENRTGVNTLYTFSEHYSVDISKSFPLLTTKDMSGRVWNSLIKELVWYFSGEHHVKEFAKTSKIWDAWSDENDNLETAYGRFWRRYPIPDVQDRLQGEAWPDYEAMQKYVREEQTQDGRYVITFDQIAYIVDTLIHNPSSRRMVLTAWHPANAAVSKLPPCHFTSVYSVSPDGHLNCHLTQRSGDIGLGIPFNIACYSAVTYILAKIAGLTPGTFSHTIVDAHIYCGEGDHDPYSHVLALQEQLTRSPLEPPTLEIKGDVDPENPLAFLDGLTFDDFVLHNYKAHPRIKMKVAV